MPWSRSSAIPSYPKASVIQIAGAGDHGIPAHDVTRAEADFICLQYFDTLATKWQFDKVNGAATDSGAEAG